MMLNQCSLFFIPVAPMIIISLINNKTIHFIFLHYLRTTVGMSLLKVSSYLVLIYPVEFYTTRGAMEQYFCRSGLVFLPGFYSLAQGRIFIY